MKIQIDDSKKNTKLPQILEAALKLFVVKGIDGTSIKDIAAAAEVAEGALYRHFKSKEELAWHLFATNLKDYTAELLGKVLSVRDTRERIQIFVRECFTSCEKNRTLFHFLILSEHRELAKFTKDYLHPGKLIEQVVAEGQQSGELRKSDPWIAFSLIFGTVHRMSVLRCWGLMKTPLTDQVDATVELIWMGVKS